VKPTPDWPIASGEAEVRNRRNAALAARLLKHAEPTVLAALARLKRGERLDEARPDRSVCVDGTLA
jgi:hypothetical protein